MTAANAFRQRQMHILAAVIQQPLKYVIKAARTSNDIFGQPEQAFHLLTGNDA